MRQSTPLGRFRRGRATQKVDQTKPHVRKCPGISRSQAGPQGPAVTEGGECYHIMFAGADPHTVRHRWQPHTDRTRPDKSGLRLFTDRQDSSVKGGWTKPSVACFPAFELTLSKKAKEKAHEVMHAKRETARKRGVAQKRGNRTDSATSCPVLAAIAASRPTTRTRPTDGSERGSADREVRNFICIIVRGCRQQ